MVKQHAQKMQKMPKNVSKNAKKMPTTNENAKPESLKNAKKMPNKS